DIGTISPMYLSSTVLDQLGAKKPAWYYLLDDLQKEQPVLTRTFYQNGAEPKNSQALSDYQMIEYDTINGKGYAKQLGFFDKIW
ncbi:MAG: hypothetical protein FWF33_07060, partial [Clostridiales bacterium]|nr:hypothetical protein [Clostridiales bacterium]